MQTIWCWSGKDHHHDHPRPRPDSAQWFETGGRTDVKRACILAPEKHLFAKPSLSSFSRLFFLRKVSFVVGDHASVSPHVNRQLERTNIAHRPSSAVRRPYPSQDGAADYMYEGLRNDPPKGVEPRLSSFNDYRSCTQRIFNFNRSSCRPLPVAVADSTGTDADHA